MDFGCPASWCVQMWLVGSSWVSSLPSWLHCLHSVPVLVNLSGRERNPVASCQNSRAERGLTNPASLQMIYEYDSGSDSEAERRLPDVVMDDLAKRRFLVKKSPVSSAAPGHHFVLRNDSPKSCSQESYPAGPLAAMLEPLRSEILIQDPVNYCITQIAVHNNSIMLVF